MGGMGSGRPKATFTCAKCSKAGLSKSECYAMYATLMRADNKHRLYQGFDGGMFCEDCALRIVEARGGFKAKGARKAE